MMFKAFARTIYLCMLIILFPAFAHAAIVDWTDWTPGTSTAATATTPAAMVVPGKIGFVTLTVTGPIVITPFTGAAGESNYWAGRAATFTAPPLVENLPPTSDVIRLTAAGLYTIRFSEPVTNPVMALLSLGGVAASTWDFGPHAFTILSNGTGAFGAVRAPLTQVGNAISGWEANGLIQFTGTMTQITFTVNPPENWSGFQLGVPRTARTFDPNAPVVTPVVTPVVVPPVPVTLTWDAPPVVKNLDGSTLVITGYGLYRGQGAVCAAVAPLPSVSVAIAPELLTYKDTVPAVIGDVCYELTSKTADAESVRSNRAKATIGASSPNAPINLKVTIP